MGARLQYNFVHDLPAFTTDTFALPLFHLALDPAESGAAADGNSVLRHLVGNSCWRMSSDTSSWPSGNGVYATLPYFIPAPTLIGTFGALIRIKSPIRSRKALFDIGIAGPIAGFLVALPVLFWGLALSKPMPADASNSALEFGYPLIFSLFHHFLSPFTPQHSAA